MDDDQRARVNTPDGLSREFTWNGEGFATCTVQAGVTTPPWRHRHATEFSLVLDGKDITSAAFVFVGCQRAATGHSLTAHWTHADGALAVAVTYSVCPTLRVLRKQLGVRGRGLLHGITLEAWPAPGASGPRAGLAHGQIGMGDITLGQPLFWNHFFLGIEHPAAENRVTDTELRCHLPTCWDLAVRGPYTAPSCVLGAAPAGDAQDAFMDYVDHLRPHPEPPFVALINNWYQFGHRYHRQPASVTGVAECAAIRALANAAQSAGAPLSTYCMDDPWAHVYGPAGLDTAGATARRVGGIWGGLSESLFPGGLPALKRAASPLDIGLWVGPFGGYLGRAALVPLGEALGFEAVTDLTDQSGFGQRKLCCHGARYHAHLRASLQHWARQGVRYWKFDGVDFTCDAADHGHPVGPGAATHQMDAWIDLMHAIREVAPGSVIAFTTGSHPSPWWLPHVDFVWRGGYDDRTSDDEAPRRERFATYIDRCLQVLRPSAMPIASIIVFGLIQNTGRTYASDGETLADFTRALWHMVGRGSHHHDLYLSPESLDGEQWRVLNEVLRWARERRMLLARSRMILGDPATGTVYGFLGWRDRQGILTLRNPRGIAQAYQLRLSDHAPRTAGAGLSIDPAFGPAPTRCTETALEGILPPYGVCVLELASHDV